MKPNKKRTTIFEGYKENEEVNKIPEFVIDLENEEDTKIKDIRPDFADKLPPGLEGNKSIVFSPEIEAEIKEAIKEVNTPEKTDKKDNTILWLLGLVLLAVVGFMIYQNLQDSE